MTGLLSGVLSIHWWDGGEFSSGVEASGSISPILSGVLIWNGGKYRSTSGEEASGSISPIMSGISSTFRWDRGEYHLSCVEISRSFSPIFSTDFFNS